MCIKYRMRTIFLISIWFVGVAYASYDDPINTYRPTKLPICPSDIFCKAGGCKTGRGGCDGHGGTMDRCGVCGGDGSACSESSNGDSSSCDKGCQTALIVGGVVILVILIGLFFIWFFASSSSQRNVVMVQSRYARRRPPTNSMDPSRPWYSDLRWRPARKSPGHY